MTSLHAKDTITLSTAMIIAGIIPGLFYTSIHITSYRLQTRGTVTRAAAIRVDPVPNARISTVAVASPSNGNFHNTQAIPSSSQRTEPAKTTNALPIFDDEDEYSESDMALPDEVIAKTREKREKQEKEEKTSPKATEEPKTTSRPVSARSIPRRYHVLSAHTARSLLPLRHPSSLRWHLFHITLSILWCSLICAGSVHYLDYNDLLSRRNSSSDTGVIIYSIVAWVSLGTVLYSCGVRSPMELNQYRSDDDGLLRPYIRITYASILILFNIATHESPSPSHTVININDVGYIFFAMLPLLFAIGFLPTWEALIFWALEQISVITLGTSTSSTNNRAIITFILASISACLVFMWWTLLSSTTAALFAIGVGYLLSHNLIPYGDVTQDMAYPMTISLIPSKSIQFIITCVASASIAVIGLILYGADVDLILEIQHLRGPSHTGNIAWDVLILTLFLLHITYDQLQHPFFFRLIRNPWYQYWANKSLGMTKPININGHQIYLWCVRILLGLYIISHCDPLAKSPTATINLFALAVCMTRAFRWIFQSTWHSLMEVLLSILISLFGISGWNDLNYAVQLLICGYIIRHGRDLGQKLEYFSVMTVTSLTRSKLRVQNQRLMTTLCILLFPIHLGLILVSSLIMAPILPFLGAPLFIIGFPRPLRVWPEFAGNYTQDEDSAYYKQMFPVIYPQLCTLFRGGILGTSSPGSFYFLRSEPYFIWFHILERGCGYISIQMKGLELQTTTCHTAEALRVDEVMESVLDQKEGCGINRHLFYTYRPLGSIQVKAYSVTKNVLTGIIDDNDNIKLLSPTFARSLVYHLHQYMKKHQGIPQWWSKSSVGSYDMKSVEPFFPTAYYAHLTKDMNVTQADHHAFKKVVLSCYAIVETLGMAGRSVTPSHICSVFSGKIPPSLYSDWLLHKDQSELLALVLRSYRCAFKAVYDCAAMASLETLQQQDAETMTEFTVMMSEFDDWFFGVTDEPTWATKAAAGTSQMFTIQQSTEENTKFTSLTLSVSDLGLRLAALNPASIRSIWCSLNMELLYFANDDDERYSIQAHLELLRNLTVQISEPPYGYPVYNTKPILLHAE